MDEISPADSGVPDLASNPPTLVELFLAFAKMSLAGFGGVLVWARRAIVEQHRWMTPDQFNEAFALCHLLPGANIVNLSIVFGGRFRGIPGSIAAFLGLLLPPAFILTILGILYAHTGNAPALQRTLAGIACAAVGLFLAVIVRMMIPLLKRRNPVEVGLMVAVFAAVGLLRLPLALVLVIAIPLSIVLTYLWRKRVAA
ncbi:MAG: chromate transporter [Xanthobacteraceae bacterium]|nr:chromate transporter [Xanthobacteraceae bacterium]